jgi:hypothetical protein
MPQTENEISGTDYDYGDFEASDYLISKIKYLGKF